METLWRDVEDGVERTRASRGFTWLPRRLEPRAVRRPGNSPPPGALAGLPVSVKDLMDVAGWPTSCGTGFFAGLKPPPREDAAYVAAWRRAGACFVGKTHLNAFAYGITGENLHWGNCVQPLRPGLLTGGSSSGAAASVQAGAACVGLGTDTGGSLRVPAALCGLVSVRLSHGRADLAGTFPLAESFDTAGWIQRHLADVPWVAAAVHGLLPDTTPPGVIGLCEDGWPGECEPEILSAQSDLATCLKQAGFTVRPVALDGWRMGVDLFVPMQAYEASRIHAKLLITHADQYEPAIRQRLEFGASVTAGEHAELSHGCEAFCTRLNEIWQAVEVLVVPAAPVRELRDGADHAATRPRFLRLTTPASLAGWPVLTCPWRAAAGTGIGFQFTAPRGAEGRLLAIADRLVRSTVLPDQLVTA